ncbi:MAG: hypothetical protein A3F09_00320 [Chlamydiae bacterium RIFCSPHIGHO2_12_FULL_49_11]|nr:MAG: hypothetical protein A3F09_00320 [Chlamydiae bacterium RIFCSPHIGHO2_12_FULL_49_11]
MINPILNSSEGVIYIQNPEKVKNVIDGAGLGCTHASGISLKNIIDITGYIQNGKVRSLESSTYRHFFLGGLLFMAVGIIILLAGLGIIAPPLLFGVILGAVMGAASLGMIIYSVKIKGEGPKARQQCEQDRARELVDVKKDLIRVRALLQIHYEGAEEVYRRELIGACVMLAGRIENASLKKFYSDLL